MITVNEEKCKELANHLLRTIDFSKLPIEERPNISDSDLEKLMFYLIAICHDTKGKYRGIVDGKTVNGWDYLFTSFVKQLKQNSALLSDGQMMNLTNEKLLKILTDDNGVKPKEDVSPRAEMLRKAATDLHKLGGFPFSQKEATFKDAQEFLNKIYCYDDPIFKKSNILISYLYDYDIWKISDPENISACIDYHVMRGSFRTGIVNLSQELITKLKNKEEISVEEDNKIRRVVLDAIELVAKFTKRKPMDIGGYFWFHFRKNCRFDKPVECDNCQNLFQFKETIVCNLKEICNGYNNPEINSIPETTVNTIYY